MAGLNQVQLIGYVGQDPQVGVTKKDAPVASVSLATSAKFKDKASGKESEHTEWHRLVFFNGIAEVVSQFVRKGSQLYVRGRLQTRKWVDDAGVERFTTEVVVEDMQMLGKKREVSGADLPEGEWGDSNLGDES